MSHGPPCAVLPLLVDHQWKTSFCPCGVDPWLSIAQRNDIHFARAWSFWGTTSVDTAPLLLRRQQLTALRQAACSVPVCVWLALTAYHHLLRY